MSEQYFEKRLRSARTFFDRWRGAPGQLWEMTRSHRMLRIVLGAADVTSKNLVIDCGPIRIEGPVEWTDSNLEASRITLPGGTEGFRIRDAGCGLVVLCDHFEVAENRVLKPRVP